MARSKNTQNKAKSPESEPGAPHTLISIFDTNDLRFKICALIYDLRNIKEHSSQHRLSSTTDPQYISTPYFSPNEANLVKSALVASEEGQTITVQAALTQRLEGFFSKRSASGDFRPCGPHDMVPIYLEVFGLGIVDLQKVESRLRRSGLPAC